MINGVKVITTGSNIFSTPVSDSEWGTAVLILPVDIVTLGVSGLSLKAGLRTTLRAEEVEKIGAMLVRGGTVERSEAIYTVRQAVYGNAGFWKVGGGSGLATLNKITASLVGKWGNYKCVEYAADLRKLLDKEGIGYRTITVENISTAKNKALSSLDAKKIFGTDIISTNGYHEAVKIGDTVYDNIHSTGIGVKAFDMDLGITEQGTMIKTNLYK